MAKSAKTIRIGPLSLFALIAMLFLSTLAVLSFTTAKASLNLSELQSTSMNQQYQAENAGQQFLALLDRQYANGSISPSAASSSGASSSSASNAESLIDDIANIAAAPPAASSGAPSSPVDSLAKEAAASISPDIVATASINGSTVAAQFACPNGRVLDIEIQLSSGKTLHIVKWNMTAKVNSAEAGNLWSGM